MFYLQAFKYIIGNSVNFNYNFVNGGGSGNMGKVGAILMGWGCDVFYLYDNDEGKRDGEICLKSDWKIQPDIIKAVVSEPNSTIADVLSNADFKKYVIGDETLKFKKNSKYLKDKKKDKVLLARLFLQTVKNSVVELNDESKCNIKALFKELDFKLDKT